MLLDSGEEVRTIDLGAIVQGRLEQIAGIQACRSQKALRYRFVLRSEAFLALPGSNPPDDVICPVFVPEEVSLYSFHNQLLVSRSPETSTKVPKSAKKVATQPFFGNQNPQKTAFLRGKPAIGLEPMTC